MSIRGVAGGSQEPVEFKTARLAPTRYYAGTRAVRSIARCESPVIGGVVTLPATLTKRRNLLWLGGAESGVSTERLPSQVQFAQNGFVIG